MPIIDLNDAYILNETGAEVDKTTGIPFKDEALTDAEAEQARANIRAGASNPNLLDNAWFTVNQRDFTSSTATNGVRCVDRWYINSGGGTGGSTTLNSDGTMTLVAGTNYQSFQQTKDIIPSSLVGKTMTISVLFADGTLAQQSFVVPAQTSAVQEISRISSSKYRVFVYLSATGTNTIIPQIQLYAEEMIRVRAVKLELGTYSTLAQDVPPDYDRELEHCKWYFERISGVSGYHAIGTGVAESTTQAQIIVPMHQKRTTAYTLAVSGSFALYNGAIKAVSNIAAGSGRSTNALVLGITSTGLTQGGSYNLITNNNAAAYIDISADL